MMKNLTWRTFNFLLPLLFWAAVFSVLYFSGPENLPRDFRQQQQTHILFFNLLLVGIFYLHSYLIYPVREAKNGTLFYILILAATMIVYLSVNGLFRPQFPQLPMPQHQGMPLGPPPAPSPLIALFPFFFVVMASFCHRLYIDKSRRDKLDKERENIHLKTELDFLSSQISPHFLFNTLNTMVSMARKKSPQLESSLMSLSQLMRYMLYDTAGNRINLFEEIQYLKSYVDLQRVRFQEDVKVNLKMTGEFERAEIAPMLLIAFIENAFKHGIAALETPAIDISIGLDKNGRSLKMIVLNGVGSPSVSEKNGGIGLNNVKRRLQLLYPNQHELKVKQKGGTFMVMLQIEL